MATYIKTIQDSLGNLILPRTRSAAITLADGTTTLDDVIGMWSGLTVSGTELNYVDGVTSSIQTQLNTKLSDIVNDTTPQLGGELDQNGKTIGGAEYDNGNSGTAKTIDWRLGNHQKVTMNGNCTFTFVAPSNPCMLSLRCINDGTAGRTKTFPIGIKLAGGTAITYTTAANGVDIVSFFWDGTNYYAQAMLDCK